MSYTRWTAEEITKLHLLLEEGKTHDAIARIMRCKPDRITNRICWEKQSAEQRQARQTRVQEWRHRTRKTPRSYVGHPTAHFAERPGARPPSELIEDAQRRALAPRSISAFVFGDPPPGYSALDRRTGA
jgi:hypothetical protein